MYSYQGRVWWICIHFWSNLQGKTLCLAYLSWKISHDAGFQFVSHCKSISSVPEQISRPRSNIISNRQQTHFHIHRILSWRGPQGSSGQTFLVKSLSMQDDTAPCSDESLKCLTWGDPSLLWGDCSYSEKFSLCLTGISTGVTCALEPSSSSCDSLDKGSLPLLYTHSSNTGYKSIIRFHLSFPFLRPNKASSSRLSSHGRFPRHWCSLWSFSGCSPRNPYLFRTEGAKTEHGFQVWPAKN